MTLFFEQNKDECRRHDFAFCLLFPNFVSIPEDGTRIAHVDIAIFSYELLI